MSDLVNPQEVRVGDRIWAYKRPSSTRTYTITFIVKYISLWSKEDGTHEIMLSGGEPGSHRTISTTEYVIGKVYRRDLVLWEPEAPKHCHCHCSC